MEENKKIQLTTLTPVHIGSGRLPLIYNKEFFLVTEGLKPNTSYFQVVDVAKLLSQIIERGTTVDDFLSRLGNKDISIEDIVKSFGSPSTPDSYYKRRIKIHSKDIIEKITSLADKGIGLVECIREGGRPYIPGSSIKGAIRTAILTSMVEAKKEKDKSFLANLFRENGITSANGKAAFVEKEFFDLKEENVEYPQSDVFRYLRVGDAYFKKGEEVAMTLYFNDFKKNLKIDKMTQLVEAIDKGKTTDSTFPFSIKLMEKFGEKCGEELGEKLWGKNTDPFKNLFNIIKAHTRKMIQKEMDILKKIDCGYKISDYVSKYIFIISNIGMQIDSCRVDECILRIGHGSGKHFITGGWAESEKSSGGVTAPSKNRRIDSNGNLLGFVKLKITK